MGTRNSGTARLDRVTGHMLPGAERMQLAVKSSTKVGTSTIFVTAAAAKVHREYKPRLAAICTTWFPQSHADVIVWKLIKGTTTDEGFFPPECEVVSLFLDQCDGRFTLTEAEAIAKLGRSPADEYAAFTAAGGWRCV